MPADKAVPSPCIDICSLDDKDVCAGCYRTAHEIAQWSLLDSPARAEVVNKALQRRREAGALL
jgi:predicted Fe-S protein YdhL (DUF1289 family)